MFGDGERGRDFLDFLDFLDRVNIYCTAVYHHESS